MRALPVLLLCLVFMAAGFVAGGAFAVKGKSNDVYLQVDNDVSTVVPLVSKGDTVSWVDANAPSAKQSLDAITFKGASPCATGVTNPCTIAIPSGRKHYKTCDRCPDPTIPVGSAGSSSFIEDSYHTDSFFERSAHGFYGWLNKTFSARPTLEPAPLVVTSVTPAPSVEIPVECVNGTLNVPTTGWAFTGADRLVPGIRIKWGYGSDAVNSFTVSAVAGSPSLSDACTSYPAGGFAEGPTGITKACELGPQTTGKTFSYTIATTSASCKASGAPFQLTVPGTGILAPQTVAPVAAPSTD